MTRWGWAAVAVGAITLAPYLMRLTWPSLYADDVVRITQVRTWPLVEILRRPFNEHLAPAHGLITWATWELCGRHLTSAPRAFTIASIVPFPLALAALGWAVRRRTGEPSVALMAVALGGLSWLYLDVVANYSGSGFVWALAGALLAFGAAGSGRWGGWVSLGASLLAPSFSAIGLLAGPLGAVGAWFGESKQASRRRLISTPGIPLPNPKRQRGIFSPQPEASARDLHASLQPEASARASGLALPSPVGATGNSQGRQPLDPTSGLLPSPVGATGNSQGRQPLVKDEEHLPPRAWGLDVFGQTPDSGGSKRSSGSHLRAALWPLAGTALYLILAASARYGETVARGLDRRIDPEIGALAAGRALSNVLPMATLGAKPAWTRPFSWTDAAAALAIIAVMAAVAWRTRRWSLLIAGLLMMVGGYALTYPFRYEGSVEWLLRVDRYHLFPHFGFVLWLSMLGALAMRRWPKLRSPWVAPALASVLLLLNGRMMLERLRDYDFREQPRVLTALETLETVCRDEGITREQALAALEPIRTSWLHPERNGTTALAMLGRTVQTPRVDDAHVRERLLARLNADAREALWGGMDVTKYVEPDAGGSVAEGVERKTAGMRPVGAGHYQGRGGSAYVEYELPASEDADARGLRLGVTLPHGVETTKLPPVEVWWSDDNDWSETRRVTWRPSNGATSGVVPLNAMPHWSTVSEHRRVRVAVKVPGDIGIEAPRLVR